LAKAFELIRAWVFEYKTVAFYCVKQTVRATRKPEEVRERIERLVARPYLELFAREIKPGWDCWGDQTGLRGYG
jgi:N6-adenosine-specific RNA methylase IME4